jgi:hypothetical protein
VPGDNPGVGWVRVLEIELVVEKVLELYTDNAEAFGQPIAKPRIENPEFVAVSKFPKVRVVGQDGKTDVLVQVGSPRFGDEAAGMEEIAAYLKAVGFKVGKTA